MIIYEYTNKMYIARQDLRQIRRIIVADYRETVDYILGIPLWQGEPFQSFVSFREP